MNTWIFQGNPKIFDLDGYLQSAPGVITWLAKQGAKDIQPGDAVFLWRSKGDGKEDKLSGVIASAEVLSLAALMAEEPESAPFWIDKNNVGKEQLRVWLKINRVAKSKEELKREWLKDDACLRSMLILRQPAGTNFKLTLPEGERLKKMWSRVGQNWSRNECIAGLWAYIETYGKEVSKSTYSPIGKVSKLTGRALTGVYNKVMNFRNIDPRDPRQGMSGGGQTDRETWFEFFDEQTQTLNEQGIRAEFMRIWDVVASSGLEELSDARGENEIFNSEVEKLRNRTLEELMAAYSRQQYKALKNYTNGPQPGKPKAYVKKAVLFDRNPLVVAIAKARAANRCEVLDCLHPVFTDSIGDPYNEVHHIVPLAEGGADTPENVVCLCPAHHREAHFGKNAAMLRQRFEEIRARFV